MEIVQERLEREYNLESARHGAQRGVSRDHTPTARRVSIDNPAELPPPGEIAEIEEPLDGHLDLHPSALHRRDHGAVTDTARRVQEHGAYIERRPRPALTYDMPLAEMIVDFYDQLKSRTQGYASLDYTFAAIGRPIWSSSISSSRRSRWTRSR